MSWLGSSTTIQCSGVSNNAVLDLRATDVSVSLAVNVNDNFVIDKYNLPNSEVDWVGTRNRRFDVRGTFDVTEPSSDKISVSGLYQLGETGSYSCWFFDEALCQWRSSSGLWVRPEKISVSRPIEYDKGGDIIGYVINYSISLIETTK